MVKSPWKSRIQSRLDLWRADRRLQRWGCGGAIAGLLAGVTLTLLVLILLAPGPLPAAPLTTGADSEIIVSINDAYLTDIINTAISSASLPIELSEIQAEILPDRQVALSGKVGRPFATPAQLIAVTQVRAQSGHLAVHIVSTYVGGLPLPDRVTSALEQPINDRLAQANQRFLPPGYVIRDVSTVEHHLLMAIDRQ